ncbi:MAG: MarR family winged helix-turn-helix transcriptional regulator [Hyphomicrobiaceae bacterium]
MSNEQPLRPLASNTGPEAVAIAIAPTPAPDHVNQILRLLRRINHATDLHSKYLIKATGLTTPQLIVLKAIHELGEVTAGTIAEHVSLSAGTVSILLDRLETHGLIERYRSTRDRRVAHARVTQKGLDVVSRAPALMRDKFIERFSRLDGAEQAQSLVVLKTIADMMDANDGEEHVI